MLDTTWSLTAANLSRDGYAGLLSIDANRNVSALLGTALGGLQSAVRYPVGRGPTTVLPTDVNGDRNLDIVTTNSQSWDISILLHL